MTPIHKWAPDGKVLILKSVEPDGTSHGGFKWPESGPVASPNWSPGPTCDSGGLFGWPWGVGIGNGKTPREYDRWLVFAAEPKDIVCFDGKVKVPRGEVIYSGDFPGALEVLLPGLYAWYQAHGSRRRKPKALSTSLPQPVIVSEPSELAYADPREKTLAVAESRACGCTAIVAGAYGVAVGSPVATSFSVTYGRGGVAVGQPVAFSCGAASIAATTEAYGYVYAKGSGSIACATGVDASVEGRNGSVCVLAEARGHWIPHPDTVLLQRWQEQDGTWATQLWHANDYSKYYGQTLQVDSGKLYLPNHGKPLRPTRKATRKRRKPRTKK